MWQILEHILDHIFYNYYDVQQNIMMFSPFVLVFAGVFGIKIKTIENKKKRKIYTFIVKLLLAIVLINIFVFYLNAMRHFADHL